MAAAQTTREKIVGVNGNLITVEYTHPVIQNEVAYALLGEARLKCEVIRIRGNRAELQIFESANGLSVGDEVTTIGGIIGRVVSIKEETFVLETTKERTKIRFLRSALKSIDVKAADATGVQKSDSTETKTEEKK